MNNCYLIRFFDNPSLHGDDAIIKLVEDIENKIAELLVLKANLELLNKVETKE